MAMRLDVLMGLLDELPLGVVLLDRDGIVVHYNRYEAQVARRRRERVVGRSFFREVAPCLDVEQLAGVFFEKIGREPLAARVEVSFPFPFLEQPRDVVIRLASFEAQGEPYGCLFIEDVSAQRSVERTRETLGQLLVHDLKNPLSVAQANLGFLRSALVDHPDVDVREALNDGLRATERLQRMLLDLLDVTQLETSAMPLERRPMDLRALVTQATAEARALGQAHRVAIESELPGDAVAAVVDERVLRRALDNLLENGVRHARPGGRVVVRARVEGARPCLEVVDDGPGVPADLRDRIFDKYTQVGAATSHNRGLGLTFVQLAARAHGGVASVECPPGGGSVFRLTL